jgi:hypothetical protein
VALCAGVLNLATAEVAATDQLLVLEGLVEGTGLGDVVGGLEVEGTLDIIKLGRFDPSSVNKMSSVMRERKLTWTCFH